MKKVMFLCATFVMLTTIAMAQVQVGLVFDAGGKFDKSFNQSAWEGATKAQKDLGIILKDAEPGDFSAVEEAMRAFASKGFDLVIGVGFANAGPIEKLAKEFPKVNFALIDSMVDPPNVASLVFEEHEGSFLVGMIGAIRSREINGQRTIGFVGGMDIPLIRKFLAGYRQGARLIYPNINVVANFVGNTSSAWNDPAKAKEITKAQMQKGASVIYGAAGASANGLFDAIKEVNGRGPCLPVVKNKKRMDNCVYAIGVDANQNYIIPGQILTSMLKRVDVAVYNVIKDTHENNFKGGIHLFGLENNGVGFAVDQYNRRLVTKKMESIVNQYRQKIIDGDLIVADK